MDSTNVVTQVTSWVQAYVYTIETLKYLAPFLLGLFIPSPIKRSSGK